MFRPGWFPEYSPAEQLIFEKLKRIIEKNYRQLGYTPIQTPAVEKNEVLLKGGEESSKQIFGLYWLAQWSEDLKEYSLHFDLTVPFARYVLDNESNIGFPFKRSQIQPVRRWERNQRWRFKEFWQADIDVIRRKENDWKINDNTINSENLFYDAEVMYVVNKTLNEIKSEFSLWNIVIKVNNRKLMQWLLEWLLKHWEIEKLKDEMYKTFWLFDDYYKIGDEKFVNWLKELINDDWIVNKLLEFTKTKLSDLKEDFVDNELFRQWLGELKSVFNFLKLLNKESDYKFQFDPFIIRWLDYYTWTVFETYFQEDVALGSVASGGRYENLTQAINPKWPKYEWVWMSIGLSRLCTILFEKLELIQQTTTEYLFVNFEETIGEIILLANKFIAEWKNIEIYPESAKLKKQFGYADKKWIENVVILGEWEKSEKIYKVKNMKKGSEKTIKL